MEKNERKEFGEWRILEELKTRSGDLELFNSILSGRKDKLPIEYVKNQYDGKIKSIVWVSRGEFVV